MDLKTEAEAMEWRLACDGKTQSADIVHRLRTALAEAQRERDEALYESDARLVDLCWALASDAKLVPAMLGSVCLKWVDDRGPRSTHEFSGSNEAVGRRVREARRGE